MHYQPNSLGYARFGIVASKKIARRAVARNYMRRVLREWFRLNREQLGTVDMVIRVQKPFTHVDFHHIQEELQRLLNRLHRQTTKPWDRPTGVKTDGAATDLAG